MNSSMESKRMKMNDEVPEASPVSLNVLNDYCLLHIFGMLSLKSRIGIERVDRRWKHLCAILWGLQRTLIISYGQLSGNVKIHQDSFGIYFNCNQFEKEFNFIAWQTAAHVDNVLKRCEGSRVLKTLKISGVLGERTLFSIGKRCPNIEHLTLVDVLTSSDGLQFLADQCKCLREIHLDFCNGVTDDALKPLFTNNDAIQVIELYSLVLISGTFLDNVSSTIQHIHVENCNVFNVKHLEKNISRFHQLLKLNLYGNSVDNSSLKCIVENAPQLQDLALYYCHGLNSHKLLIKLTNLINLNLDDNRLMDDDAFRLITARCLKLESLSISGRGLITNNAFQNLTYLSNLKILSLTYLSITDDALQLISTIGTGCLQLEELYISDCWQITNYGFQNVQNLSNLKKLSLICLSITDDALKLISRTTIGREGVGCIQIESLDIQGCKKITNNGIQHLTNLTNLKILNISNLPLINDEALFALSNVQTLRKLYCCCRLIADRGVKEILHKCKKLTYLDASFCNITMSTVNEAINVIKTNRTNLPLLLNVGRTRMSLEEIPASLPATLDIIYNKVF